MLMQTFLYTPLSSLCVHPAPSTSANRCRRAVCIHCRLDEGGGREDEGLEKEEEARRKMERLGGLRSILFSHHEVSIFDAVSGRSIPE